MPRRKWTQEELDILEEEYKKGTKICDISEILNRTQGSVSDKAQRLGLTEKYVKSNNPKFKAVYQDYDWCYERYINRGMTHEEIAEEAGASLRVIQKWCTEKHGLHRRSFKEIKKLNDLQYQVILFGTLGDGHIDRRENQPMYIECHSIDEKDYLFYKYNILKDLCNQLPVYHSESYNNFGKDVEYLCKPFYRFETRIINDLKQIRSMSRYDKINKFNEYGFCLHILDDGSRGNLWENCLAEWSDEEIELYIRICNERFGLVCKKRKDPRYVMFDAKSSKLIDEMILRNIPNNLDIVHKKIINNNKIKEYQNCIYINTEDGGKIGLANYCKQNHWEYESLRDYLRNLDINYISENEIIDIYYNEV